MKNNLKQKLIEIAREKTRNNDASHDIGHALRVFNNVLEIAKKEGGDLDILIPAALFHDVIIYPKNHPSSKLAPAKSAELTKKILSRQKEYPKHKIKQVCIAISECSFHKKTKPRDIETKILRDADKLEATGIIAIMRTFASTGHMGINFYEPSDPFCENRKPDAMKYGLDLFYERLLIIEERVYTKTAKKIARQKTKFLRIFLDELRKELK
jgi:uncharacterized protein